MGDEVCLEQCHNIMDTPTFQRARAQMRYVM